MNREPENLQQRAGEQFRSNPERFFHVMAEGWFIFTREGIRGPFVDKPRAKGYLVTLLEDLKSEDDPSASWRL